MGAARPTHLGQRGGRTVPIGEGAACAAPQHARGVAKQSARPHQRAPPWSTKAQRRNAAMHEACPGALTESVAGMAEIGLEVRGKLRGSDISYDAGHKTDRSASQSRAWSGRGHATGRP